MTKDIKSPTPKREQPGIGRSTLINLSGLLVPTIVALITVPLYLKQIGEVRYGVLLLAFTFLGYFGAFDLGLGRAVAQRVARQDSIEERNHTFWTAFIISGIMGVVGAIVLYFLGQWLFSEVFNIPTNLRHEMVSAIPWLAAIVPITAIISVLAGTLEGRQAFLAMNISQIIGVIGLQVLPLSAAMLGHKSMPVLLASALIGRLLGVIVLIASTSHMLPIRNLPHIHKPDIGPLLRFGGWMTLSGMAIPLLSIIDRFFIGTVIGPAAVTAYAVPYNLTQRFTYLPYAISTTLYPRFARNLESDQKKLLNDGISTLVAIQTPLIILGILIMHPFLDLWVGSTLASRASPVAIIFLIALWINGPAYIPHNMLPAIGRPDIMVKFYAWEIIPFLILLYIFIKDYGIIGAAIIFAIRAVADSAFCFIITNSSALSSRLFLITAPFIIVSATLSWQKHWGALTIIIAFICFTSSLYTAIKIMPQFIIDASLKKLRSLMDSQGN
ncbi:flippase [Acidithiobacillus sulfurivorans]|uniref:Flippase n=1 Tax=Acidithiobacillus sulfurivorans TaxID=1958756 RepID=A0ABS5ZUM2_9PROT|nr:flippase [Acidithiobacillus sulfurivorans]MBU2758864.1 flippase [Acidithiobacillus sulfurivorans]